MGNEITFILCRNLPDWDFQADEMGFLADGTYESNCYYPCTSTKVLVEQLISTDTISNGRLKNKKSYEV